MRMGKTRMNRELNKELFAGVGKLSTDELQPTALRARKSAARSRDASSYYWMAAYTANSPYDNSWAHIATV